MDYTQHAQSAPHLRPEIFGATVCERFEELGVPFVAVDLHGVVVWSNNAAVTLLGDHAGRSYLTLIPEEHHAAARVQFERKLAADGPTTERMTLLDRLGRPVEVLSRSVPVSEAGRIVGVVGIALPLAVARIFERPEAAWSDGPLTPRQEQVLRLLAEGRDTEEIAERLGIAYETARNHIRGVLARLDAHSRLEAVVAAARLGLLELRPDD